MRLPISILMLAIVLFEPAFGQNDVLLNDVKILTNTESLCEKVDVMHLLTDNNGNIYCGGEFYEIADFDPSAGVAIEVAANTKDIFVAKYDSQGNHIFSGSVGNASFEYINDMQLDQNGHLYLLGLFTDSIDLDLGDDVLNHYESTGGSLFLTQYDINFEHLSTKIISPENAIYGDGELVIDQQGFLHVFSPYSGTVELGVPGSGEYSSNGSQDIFWAKYDNLGNLVNSFSFGGPGQESVVSATLDSEGMIWLSGTFRDSVDIDPGAGNWNIHSNGFSDNFVARFNLDGELLGANSFGNESSEYGLRQAPGLNGELYVCGEFSDSIAFDSSGVTMNLYVPEDADGMYIANFDTSGQYIFGKSICADNAVYSGDIGISGGTEIVVAGAFTGSVDFDPGPDSALFEAPQFSDAFVAKFDLAGEFIEAFTYGNLDLSRTTVIYTDISDTILIAGQFGDTLDFNIGVDSLMLSSGHQSLNGFMCQLVDSFPNWAINLGTYQGEEFWDYAQDMDKDANGNWCITGFFEGGIDFDLGIGESILSSEQNNRDAFIAKYDENDNLLFSFLISGESIAGGEAITIDNQGNVIVAGTYRSTVDMDPGPGTSFLGNVQMNDIFVGKYSPTGDHIFSFGLGSLSWEYVYAIDTDSDGNIYIAGKTQGTLDFDPGPGISENENDGTDGYVAKYDPNGAFLYLIPFSGDGTDIVEDIAIDPFDNVFVVGTIDDIVDMDPGPGVANIGASELGNSFIAKYNSNGDLIYADVIGQITATGVKAVRVDQDGFPYITGAFYNTVDLDPTSDTYLLNSNGSHDIFMAKFNPSGSLLYAGSSGGLNSEFPFDLAVDDYGRTYVVGARRPYPSTSETGLYLIKFDAIGNLVDEAAMYSSLSIRGTCIDVVDIDTIRVSGFIEETVDFDPSAGENIHSALNDFDIFLANYTIEGGLITESASGVENAMDLTAVADEYISIYNGSESFNANLVRVSDISGRVITEFRRMMIIPGLNRITIVDTPGMYVIEFIEKDRVSTVLDMVIE